MAAPIRPLPRLLRAMSEQQVSVKAAARTIGRSEVYLSKRLKADSYLLDLSLDETTRLGRSLGVPLPELRE